MYHPVNRSVVVIGYGNTLRGDDAVGRSVIDALADREVENLELMSVTQLVPELAAIVARASAVIFVDACLTSCATEVEAEVVSTGLPKGQSPHHMGAEQVMALADACFHATPPAWLVRIPVCDFSLTDGISANAEIAVATAINVILKLITRLREGEVARA